VRPHNPATGFDLPLQQWSLLNHFRTKQGHCVACRRKWRLTDTDLYPCDETRTMSHIVKSCPLTKLNGGLSRLHSADEDAVSWLNNYVAAFLRRAGGSMLESTGSHGRGAEWSVPETLKTIDKPSVAEAEPSATTTRPLPTRPAADNTYVGQILYIQLTA